MSNRAVSAIVHVARQRVLTMFKYAICAVVVAAPTYVLAVDIDMTSITCQSLFFDQPPEKKTFNIAINLQWFNGYYHRDAGRTSIDPEKQRKLSEAVGRHCGLRRQEKVFDVYGRLFREIYLGRRVNVEVRP